MPEYTYKEGQDVWEGTVYGVRGVAPTRTFETAAARALELSSVADADFVHHLCVAFNNRGFSSSAFVLKWYRRGRAEFKNVSHRDWSALDHFDFLSLVSLV